MGKPEFDLATAHRFFSADCFNSTWGLIDKADRSPEDDEQMLLLALASAWHWTQRRDCEPSNLAVGFWQISHVHALLGRADEARRYGRLSLDAIEGKEADPFTLGYAYEALARAESVAGDRAKTDEYLNAARKSADEVTDEEPKKWLLDDLATIG
ncbi:MAG: hypothetical protein WBC63_05750 [Candidatus Bipolaricaulia bacterium]